MKDELFLLYPSSFIIHNFILVVAGDNRTLVLRQCFRLADLFYGGLVAHAVCVGSAHK